MSVTKKAENTKRHERSTKASRDEKIKYPKSTKGNADGPISTGKANKLENIESPMSTKESEGSPIFTKEVTKLGNIGNHMPTEKVNKLGKIESQMSTKGSDKAPIHSAKINKLANIEIPISTEESYWSPISPEKVNKLGNMGSPMSSEKINKTGKPERPMSTKQSHESQISTEKANKPENLERRGYLRNQYTGCREYFVLRGGVVRIFESPHGPASGAVFLYDGSRTTLLSKNTLELSSRVPYVQEHLLVAASEHEAKAWQETLQSSILAERSKGKKMKQLLENGYTMHKYNYSNSKHSRRFLWVANGGLELCWGKSKDSEDMQKVDLSQCIGIVYGPVSTTFRRCTKLQDPSWTCFSVLLNGRTLDFAVAGDLAVRACFLGLQRLISRHGTGSMPMMCDAQFMARKVQLKLTDAAHVKGLVLGRYILECLRALATRQGLTGLGRGAVVSGGSLPMPLSFTPVSRQEQSQTKHHIVGAHVMHSITKRDSEPENSEKRGYLQNARTGNREYLVLRDGVLRIRQSACGPDSGVVFLAHGSSVALLPSNTLEVRSKVPQVREYLHSTTDEHDAKAWHIAIQASILAEKCKVEKLAQLLEDGCTIRKYNYSNSKHSRRYFWVANDGLELCWGKYKDSEDAKRVDLQECNGIIYGPMTTTFQRCPKLEDASWRCFSLLFNGRTIDLAVAGDLQVRAWVLGMQHSIARHDTGSMPMLSDAQFLARKVQLKLTDAAHAKGLVLGRFILEGVRAVAAERGLTTQRPINTRRRV